MFGCSCKHTSTEGSADQAFESASARASFYAALLLLIDTVIAVSIFVSAEFAAYVRALPVFGLLQRVLLTKSEAERSKPLAA